MRTSLIVPNFQSIKETHDRFKTKLTGPLKEAATKHMDDAASQLEKMLEKKEQSTVFLLE